MANPMRALGTSEAPCGFCRPNKNVEFFGTTDQPLVDKWNDPSALLRIQSTCEPLIDVRNSLDLDNPPCGSKFTLNSYRQTSATPKKTENDFWIHRCYFSASFLGTTMIPCILPPRKDRKSVV